MPWRPTCPSVRVSSSSSSSPQAHLTRVSTLSGPGNEPVSGQLCETTGGGASHDVPVSCRLSATGIRFLGHPFPAGELGLPCGRLTGPRHGMPDPIGVPRSTRTRLRPGWVPSLPRGRRCSHGRQPCPGRRLPLHNGQSLHPGPHPISGLRITRHQRGFTAFTRPVFPSPVAPGWNGRPWAFPRASHPAVTSDARQGGDRPLSTGLGLRRRQHQSTLQFREPARNVRPRVARVDCMVFATAILPAQADDSALPRHHSPHRY
jgi:hypothetical protein